MTGMESWVMLRGAEIPGEVVFVWLLSAEGTGVEETRKGNQLKGHIRQHKGQGW